MVLLNLGPTGIQKSNTSVSFVEFSSLGPSKNTLSKFIFDHLGSLLGCPSSLGWHQRAPIRKRYRNEKWCPTPLGHPTSKKQYFHLFCRFLGPLGFKKAIFPYVLLNFRASGLPKLKLSLDLVNFWAHWA